MDEIYKILEEKIKEAGYSGAVSGYEIYNEICDEIEDKENGSYIFMSKKTEDTFFEFNIQIMDKEFNLSSILINDKGILIEIDFDLRKGSEPNTGE